MFRKKHFLDEDVDAFHIQCWAWLLRSTGGLDAFKKTELVLPSPAFFPPTDVQGYEKAQYIFERTRALAGMSDWAVELVAQNELPREVSHGVYLEHEGVVVGTFSFHGNGGRITFDPLHIEEPVTLIATFSHELGHYLNGTFEDLPPGGEELIEPATDVTAAFMGFGVFGLSNCFNFSKSDEGWSSRKLGYISFDEWAFNLGIFCILGEHPLEKLKPYLSRHAFTSVRASMKFIAKNDIQSIILESASDAPI